MHVECKEARSHCSDVHMSLSNNNRPGPFRGRDPHWVEYFTYRLFIVSFSAFNEYMNSWYLRKQLAAGCIQWQFPVKPHWFNCRYIRTKQMKMEVDHSAPLLFDTIVSDLLSHCQPPAPNRYPVILFWKKVKQLNNWVDKEWYPQMQWASPCYSLVDSQTASNSSKPRTNQEPYLYPIINVLHHLSINFSMYQAHLILYKH